MSGITPLSLFTAEHPTAEVRDLNLDELLPSAKTYLDRTSAFTLAAVTLALQDADLAPDAFAPGQAGIVLGSEFGCLGTMQIYTSALQQKGARLANPLLFSHMYVNTPTSLAAIEFGLRGHHGTFAGQGAGRQALESAGEALRLGRAEVMLAVGVDSISEPLYRRWSRKARWEPTALGEGACALVLETGDHAAQRHAAGIALGEDLPDGIALRPQLGRTFAAEPFFRTGAPISSSPYLIIAILNLLSGLRRLSMGIKYGD